MFNNTANITDSSYEKTWDESYSYDEGFDKTLFLIPVIIVGSFTVLAILRYFSSKK